MGKKLLFLFAAFAALYFISGCSNEHAAVAGQAGHDTRSTPPIVIAHRGASGYAPEHTIPAYRMAEKMDTDYIEIDLQMTKDRQLIAMHDDKVDRTTNGTGSVKELTLDQIKSLDAGSWFNQKFPGEADSGNHDLSIPTLQEVIQTFGKQANYYIETKKPAEYPGMEDELLKVLKKNHLIHSGAENRKVIIESFSADSLKRLNDRYPQLFLVQLGYPEKMDLPAISRYADAVGPDYQGVTESFVRKAHEEQLQVHPWTVNSVSDMKRLTGFGVDGMFTNYPDKADDITQSP